MRLDHLLSMENRDEEISLNTSNGQIYRKSESESLFNFEGSVKAEILKTLWGCSSAGRAPALHAGGQEFEPPHLHHAESKGLARHGLIAQPVRAHA